MESIGYQYITLQKRAVIRSFDVFFFVTLKKLLNEQYRYR